jgi:2,5-diketo-D-gluconate reductase B
MRRTLEESLAALRTDYVDLWLIHWPAPGMNLARSLGAMVRAREDGLVRHIGVSNFTLPLLEEVAASGVPVVCNQVEYHVCLDQRRILAWLRAHGMALVAYSPLGRGGLMRDATLQRIARKHGAAPAQIMLAWLLGQEGVAAVPKAARPENQRANLEAASLQLDTDDLAAIAALAKNERQSNPPGVAPAWDPPE